MYDVGSAGCVNKRIVAPIIIWKLFDHHGKKKDATPNCKIFDVLKSPSEIINGVGNKISQ